MTGDIMEAPLIIDVSKQDTVDRPTLRDRLVAALAHPRGERVFPGTLLYDETGLRLFDEMTTHAPEYYLFRAEEQILKTHGNDIARTMRSGRGGRSEELVLELGAGALRKTSIILDALTRTISDPSEAAPITYYALDLDRRELERTLKELENSEVGRRFKGKIALAGMLGEYQEGIRFVREGGLCASAEPSSTSSSSADVHTSSQPRPTDTQAPLHILFLGSTLGNFSRTDAAAFLRALPLRPGRGDTLLLGLDHANDPAKIEGAYNDPQGYTPRFIMNGLRVAGAALGDPDLFPLDRWSFHNSYHVEERVHVISYRSKCDHAVIDPKTCEEHSFARDELVTICPSAKFSDADARELFDAADLHSIERWTNDQNLYSLWLLERGA